LAHRRTTAAARSRTILRKLSYDAFRQRTKRSLDSPKVRRGPSTRSDNHIEPARQIAFLNAKRFTKQSLPTISHHGIPDLSGNGQTDSRAIEVIPTSIHHQHVIRSIRFASEDPIELGLLA
jgi:hypothetical protein